MKAWHFCREDLTLGFNITRDTHEGETWDWSLLAPPLSPMATSRFGTVTGVDNRAAGKWFAMFPYALARLRSDPNWAEFIPTASKVSTQSRNVLSDAK